MQHHSFIMPSVTRDQLWRPPALTRGPLPPRSRRRRRRKKKAVHKTTSTDDKRLQSTLKRLGVNTIPGIEEVLLINNDGSALQFNNPKVQASIAANTYVVSGASQPKREWRWCWWWWCQL